jgi:hypothetical protein
MSKRELGNDQHRRIEELKRRAEELSDGQMELGGLDDCLSETEESFLKYIVDYEEAPWTTHFRQLEEAGLSLPEPDSLTDHALTSKLWEVIRALALLRVFIDQTDHLSDRELYEQLWSDVLREETKALTLTANSACHIQMLGDCSEEHNWLYLKYYADDAMREHWREGLPNDPVPAHEDPPYDRDRLLPKPDYDPPASQQPN